MIKENFSLIFDDSPISRAYLKILIDLNLTKINLFVITDKYFFINKTNNLINFINKNLNAIKLINNNNLINFIFEIEEYFKLGKGFIFEMYKYKNINYFENIITINNRDINSETLRKHLINSNDKFILNTSTKILKSILDINKLFLHIHPAYLPDVRGADGSLNSLNFKNEIGCSAFFMNKKIDCGDIIFRKKFKLPKFRNLKLELFNNMELYNIWYSFFDPLLRAHTLKKIISIEKFDIIKQKSHDGTYFSYINKKDIKKILSKVIYEN